MENYGQKGITHIVSHFPPILSLLLRIEMSRGERFLLHSGNKRGNKRGLYNTST